MMDNEAVQRGGTIGKAHCALDHQGTTPAMFQANPYPLPSRLSKQVADHVLERRPCEANGISLIRRRTVYGYHLISISCSDLQHGPVSEAAGDR
jgi:hypothetical protein